MKKKQLFEFFHCYSIKENQLKLNYVFEFMKYRAENLKITFNIDV